MLHYLLFIVLRVLQGFVQRLRFGGVRKLLLESRQLYRNILRKDGSGFGEQHAFTGYLQDELPTDFGTVSMVLLPSFSKDDPFRLQKRHFWGVYPQPALNEEYIHFRASWRPAFWKRFRESKKQLKRSLKLLRQQEVQGFQAAIRHLLLSYHKSAGYFLFKHIAWSLWLQGKGIDLLSGIDEYSVNNRIVFEAAHVQGMRTVALQHGNFHELHPGYRYAPVERQQIFYEMALWGESWSAFLQKWAGMDPQQLHLTGAVRTDVIPALLKRKEDLKATLSLPEDKRIVLFASQPLRDDAQRWHAASEVFQGIRDLSDVHLIFKPHPREKDYAQYDAIAAALGCTNYSILTEEDLYLLLAVAEVVIVLFSTVGQEAVYFHKNLITLDPEGLDQAAYQREGVALAARDVASLRAQLLALLDGSKKLEAKAQEAYIRQYALAVDGKSSQRILAVLSR